MSMNLRNFFSGASGNNATQVPSPGIQTGAMGVQTPSTAWYGIDGSAQVTLPQRLRDVLGKMEVSQAQNIYEADFEYGTQPLRWENFIQNVSGNASIVQNPGLGGVTMTIGGANSPGDITIRQSRPYHRYQPGKTMYMASNVNFGGATLGQFQRVGIFDDSNGIFIMQNNPTVTNPAGMYCVIRSDSGGTPVDTVFDMGVWNGNQNIINSLNWNAVQMVWMEYAWYGAGALRWGVTINGEPWILHQVGAGNATINGTLQVKPWSRTGNLPVRYEQRNSTTGAASVMTHYGVSVLIEGGRDPQRGFTYSYGNDAVTQNQTVPASSKRYPAMSFRMKPMGTNLFDQTYAAVSSGTQTSLTIGSSGAVGGSATISSVVGQGNGGNALITFSGAHGYPVTVTAQNQPAQYITLSSFTQNGIATAYTIAGAVLTVTTVSANTYFNNGQILTGTGITGSPTIVNQLTATNSASATPTFVGLGAVGTSTILLSSGNNISAGMIVSGTGVPAGTIVNFIQGATVTLSNVLTAQAAGTYNFNIAGAAGTYTVSSASAIAGATGNITGTTTYPAATYLIQQVNTTTTLTIQIVNYPFLGRAATTPTATYWGVNQFVGKFIYYQASLPSITGWSGLASTTIAGLTQYYATITFSTPHYLNINDQITVSGVTVSSGTNAYNGIFTINSLPSSNTAVVYFGNISPTATTNITANGAATAPYTGRNISNTVRTLTFQDVVTGNPLNNSPAAGNNYQIGLIDRGQLLPTTLLINSSATCLVELIASTPTNQTTLVGANFVALNTLGSYNSFAQQDLSATELSGGEVVYAFSTANNGLQQLDLSNFFPVLTNIKGNVPDILTIAVTTSAGATMQVNVVCQEAMA